MNYYLAGVTKFFSGEETFEVEGENKLDALMRAQSIVKLDPKYRSGGNYMTNSVRIIKKLQRHNSLEA